MNRRIALIFAVTSLVAGFQQIGFAQSSYGCEVGIIGGSRAVRANGQTELVAPVTIDCGGSAPVGGITATVVLNFSAPVTSKPTGPQAGKTEAVITQNPPVSPFTEGVNAFFGTQTASNQLTFTNVPIAPSGNISASANLVINNLRIDATSLSIGTAVNVNVTINATASISVSTTLQTVATVQAPLGSSSANPLTYEQCQNLNRDPSLNPTLPLDLIFSEGHSASFKNVSGESGLVLTGFTGNPGQASHGTILGARLTGVPAGVTLWMSAGPISGSNLFTAQIAPEILTTVQSRYNGTFMRLPVDANGNALALWEITGTSDGFDFGLFRIVVEYPANQVAAGTAFVTEILHPGTATTRIPRFTATGSTNPAFTITPGCQRLTCSATPLNFVAASGATAITPQQTTSFTVNTGATTPFTASTSLPFIVNPLSGATTAGSSTSSANLNVSANPNGVNPGTYGGRVLVSALGAECSIPTILTITAPVVAPELDILTFEFDASRTVTPAQQTVRVSSNGGPVNVQLGFSGDDQWINPSPLQFQAPGTFVVRPNAQGLALRNYEGTLRLITVPGQPAVTMIVRLIYRPTQVTFNPNPLNLSYQLSSSQVPAGTIAVTSTPSALGISNLTAATDDGRNWLRVTAQGTATPTNLSVSVDTAAINQTPGTYGGTISLRGADNVTYSTRVILTVTQAGSLTVNPQNLTFNHQIGAANPAPQSVSVASSSSPINFQVSSDQTWLSATSSSPTTPASLSVAVNPANLTAGSYTGNITVTGAGQTVVVRVTLVVTQPLITVQPSALSFAYQIGGSNPAAQAITLTSPQRLNFALSASTITGGAWLALAQTSGQTDASVGVTVNPQNLTAGTYQGSITVTGDGRTQTVPVTLTVTQGTFTLTASPNPISFFYQFGSSTFPTAQNLTLSSFTPVNYTIQAASVGNWLSVSQTSGSTQVIPGGSPSSTVVVTANPQSLAASSVPYAGTLTITSPTAATVVVNVSLTVSGGSFTVTPSSLAFTYQSGGALPSTQLLTISGVQSGQAISVTATSAQNWLVASLNTGSVPPTVIVSAQPGALTQGIYSGSVQVTVAGQTVVVPVTLTIQQQSLTVTPNVLTFNYSPGGTLPDAQTVSVSTVPSGVFFSATASSTGGWLSVVANTSITPATLTVTVAPGSLPTGVYTGQITVSANGATEIVTVTLRVEQFTLSVSPSSLSFTFQPGGDNPPAQNVSVTSVPAGVNFTASSSASWLSAGGSGGRTPATLNVSVNPSGLEPGTYNGTITVSAQGQTQSVAVTLTVGSPTLTVNPGSLTFNAVLTQDPPASQTVSVSSVPPGLNFTASASANAPWLAVGISASRTPASLTVSADPTGLDPGTYTGNITVSAAGQTASVAVTLVVTGGRLSVSPTNIDLSFQAGGTAPGSTSAQVTSDPPGLLFSFTNSASEWLSVEASNSRTPATLTLRPNVAQLAPGTYTATISVTAAGAVNTPVTLRVTLQVTGTPSIGSISRTSATTGEPGFLLTVNGTNFVPGSQILLNNTPLPTTFVSSTQLTAQVPPSALLTPGPLTILVTNPGQIISPPATIVVKLAPAQVRLETTGNTGPGDQPRLGVVLSQAQTVPVTGTVSFTFDGRDTTVQFATGGRSSTFTIPAGSLRADLPFSTGTVAGALQFTVRITGGGADITPDPTPATSVTIPAGPPVLRTVTIARSATGFEVVITGFSTPRNMTEVSLTFTGNVSPNQVTTNVSGIFGTHYGNAANDQFGSQFELRYPFTGQTTGITSVSVTMSNSIGRSNAVSANF